MAKVISNPEYMTKPDDDDGWITPSFTYCQTADCIPLQPTTRSYGSDVDPSSNSHIIPSPPDADTNNDDNDDDEDVDDAYDMPVRHLPKVTPRQ